MMVSCETDDEMMMVNCEISSPHHFLLVFHFDHEMVDCETDFFHEMVNCEKMMIKLMMVDCEMKLMLLWLNREDKSINMIKR